MFPFGPFGPPVTPRQAMDMDFLYGPLAGERMMHRHALNRGRMQGYAAAMHDMAGADRLARFADVQERMSDRDSKGGPERRRSPCPIRDDRKQPALLAFQHDRGSKSTGHRTTSGGTVITKDAHEKYLAYKAKADEYSQALKKGPNSTSSKRWKSERSKHGTSSTSSKKNGSNKKTESSSHTTEISRDWTDTDSRTGWRTPEPDNVRLQAQVNSMYQHHKAQAAQAEWQRQQAHFVRPETVQHQMPAQQMSPQQAFHPNMQEPHQVPLPPTQPQDMRGHGMQQPRERMSVRQQQAIWEDQQAMAARGYREV